jgi:hypothetical protein
LFSTTAHGIYTLCGGAEITGSPLKPGVRNSGAVALSS